MVPSPASGTDSQPRLPQEGQNSLGGIASSPHCVQRMAVSRPARTSAKKSFRLTTSSVTAKQAHEDGGGVAAQRVGEAGARAVDLARSRLAAKLGHDLGDLGGAGGADRMALGLEAAGDVDGDLAAEARPALLGRGAAHARLDEAEPPRGHHLPPREGAGEL